MNYLILISVMLFSIILVIAITEIKTLRMMKYKYEFKKKKYDDSYKTMRYAKETMKFLKQITTEVSIIEFNKFADNRELEKINIKAIESVLTTVSTEVVKSIDERYFLWDENVIKKEFYLKYITDIASVTLKRLLTEYINSHY